MPDYLDTLANSALETIKEGYYKRAENITRQTTSLQQAILKCSKVPIISEIKVASPSQGTIRQAIDIKTIAREMVQGGAVGISILTEPKHFKGQLESLLKTRDQVDLPILMKDIILNHEQIDVARRIGGDAILLIHALFDRGYATESLPSMIEIAHKKGLEVLLEVHTEEEFLSAMNTQADMIGINNRDLRSLKVNLDISKRILSKYPPGKRVIVSESGIQNLQDLQVLRACGVHAFLIGTTLMKSTNLEIQLRKFVEAK
jgi:indole-3-glycerol phosphate synthase